MMNEIVFKKGTKQIFKIYDIKRDKNGYAHFLVYNFYNQDEWNYISAKNFTPNK